MSEIYWTIICSVKPGRFEELQRIIDQLVLATKAEPGSIAYEYSADDDRSEVRVLEAYRSSADAVLHLTRTFSRFAAGYAACADVTDFVVHGRPDADLTSILDAQGCRYFTPLSGYLHNP